MGTIPGQFKPKAIKIGITAFLLDVQQLQTECEAFTEWGRLVERWAVDSSYGFYINVGVVLKLK